ncbi:hypothetical protein N9917_02340 [Deltaproteobacteria bacterium]|nr:hypothetical protein [Deltaproteobacteria bacterium]
MATLQELEGALINAAKAGDKQAARILADVIIEARENPLNLPPGAHVQGTRIREKKPEPTFGEKMTGAAEALEATATGMTTGMVGHIGGTIGAIAGQVAMGEYGDPKAAQRVAQIGAESAQDLTVMPKTPLGQEYTENVAHVMEATVPMMPMMAETHALSSALSGGLDPAKARIGGKIAADDAVRIGGKVRERMGLASAEESGRGVGAAEVGAARVRRLKAQNLDVPMDLTESQASKDFKLVQEEREIAKNPEIGEPLRQRYSLQNEQLVQNLDAWIDSVGGESFNLYDIGKAITEPLRNAAAKAKRKIRVAYKEAEKAGEMESDVRHFGLVEHLNSSVPEQSVSNVLGFVRDKIVSLGGAIENQYGDLVSQPMSLKNSELLRRSVGNATNVDPVNIRHAAIMKKAMDMETEGMGGNLYKNARKLRAEYGKQFENNILVKSILGFKKGSTDRAVATEKVLNNSVLSPSTPLDSVTHLKKLFLREGAEGKQAWKEVQGGVLQHIRDEAIKGVGRDINGNPIVSADKLNKAITGLDNVGKLDEVFGLDSAGKLRTLNEVASDVLVTPPGSVNFSNTASMLAAFFDMTVSGLSGIPAPVASGVMLGVKGIKNAKLRAKVAKALKVENPEFEAGPHRSFGIEAGEVVEPPPPGTPPPGTPPPGTPPAPAAPTPGAGPGNRPPRNNPPASGAESISTINGVERPAGYTSEVYMSPSEKLETQYVIMEAEELITSHTDNFTKTKEFPEELQPRDRERAAYEVQVMDIENNIRPEWLGESADIQTGAPIIGPDGFIESGNGRTIAIRRAYRRGKANEYKKYLQENADIYGIALEDVSSMKNPVLVRKRKTHVNRKKFVELANEDRVSDRSAPEVVKRDVELLPDISEYDIIDSNGLTSAAARPFIRKFFEKVIPKSKLVSMIGADNVITQFGLVRLKNAIYGKAYGSRAANIARIAETTESNVKNVTNGLGKASPKYASMREKISKGDLHDLDISTELLDATERLSKIREDKTTFAESSKQTSMFSDGATPITDALTQLMESYGRSSEKVADFVLKYVDEVEKLGNPKQGDLFGEVQTPKKIDFLNNVIKSVEQ